METSITKKRKAPKWILNPKWLPPESQADKLAVIAIMDGGRAMENIFPDAFGKTIATDGEWVLVTDPPSSTPYTVEPFSAWFAFPDPLVTRGVSRYRVKILKPEGELWLWAFEYQPMKDMSSYVATEGVIINYLTGSAKVDEMQLLYLRSRGISKEDALIMLMDSIKSQFYCYLTIPRNVQRAMAGVGSADLTARNRILSLIDRQEKKKR